MASFFDVGSKRKDKKEEDEGHGAVYAKLDKTAVLQEARLFNQTPLNPRKCVHILTKILVILGQSDKVGKVEATDTFFAMTKLFQSNDQNLRRMLYLVIKELATIADDVIIVTSSLTKDMTGPEVAFRGPAIRALCAITDSAMVQSIERYLKQAIVDKSPAIASAVLTSAYKLMAVCPEIIKRWTNEIQEAASGSRIMVQYHALGLLYLIRQSDRLAVTKLIQKFTRSTLRSPYAYCLMIRIVAKQLNEDGHSSNPQLFEFLESSLRHKSEMVIYEAARAIVSLRNLTAKELAPAVGVLQLLCTSSKPALRYAAVHTLNSVASNHPAAVTACNLDLEQLIGDPNRSIATLAITTLLKTGNELNVERLLKHVSPFMSEISDEFKIVVLESIRALATKYPKKYTVLLSFLSGLLRDSAGYTFKKAVVVTMESIIKQVPEAKSIGLLQLCDFIEDCEHVKLTQRILHLLGREGPYLKRPRQFTRYIYNRIMLESAPIKCTATTALARFAAHNEELLPSILVLLKRIMIDEDDEVRDRAAFYHYILSNNQAALKSAYLLSEEMHLSPSGLERALLDYVHNAHSVSASAFSLATVPIADISVQSNVDALNSGVESDNIKIKMKPTAETGEGRNTLFSCQMPGKRIQDSYAEQLASISEFSSLGPIFKSSPSIELTESDTEYVVTCMKHVFLKHLVLQFDCTNTMADQILENVYVSCEPDDSMFNIICTIPCKSLKYNSSGVTYVLIELPENIECHSATFMNTLRFTVKDVDSDPSDPGLLDEYQLEDLVLGISDHVQRVSKQNFTAAWQELSPETEVEETYILHMHKTIKGMHHFWIVALRCIATTCHVELNDRWVV
ncbi:Coatomer subunit gamma-2 [Schistosoma japonicum]|nr:Coatomer subunit gamma-2 [Schistosoma japonicum]